MMDYKVMLFLIWTHLSGGTDTDVNENDVDDEYLATISLQKHPFMEYYGMEDQEDQNRLTKAPEYPVKVFVMDPSTSTYNDDPVLIPQLNPFEKFPMTVSQLTNPAVEEYQVTSPLIRVSKPAPLNLDCEKFAEYATNCSTTAMKLYNSTRKAPPLPHKLDQWCSALRHLTSCGRDWNLDCKDVTYNHFNEDSLVGHSYVIENICKDPTFIEHYADMTDCLLSVVQRWEACYKTFKDEVDELRSSPKQWTHYEQHFYLCCARAHFRGCTLNITLSGKTRCTETQALTLQRFSVIVSEGDVNQNCSFNIHYPSCPGGDPRPTIENPTLVPNTVELRSNQANLCINPQNPLLATFVFLFLLKTNLLKYF